MVNVGAPLVVALVVLAVAGACVAGFGQLGHGRGVLTASARATLQLAAVALVIAALSRAVALSLIFVAMMYVVATWTAGRRVARSGAVHPRAILDRRVWWAVVPIGLGAAPLTALLIIGRVVPPAGLAVIPTAGILVGGAMTATSLSGRRAVDELTTRRGEVEAALALGFSDRDAAAEICRPAAASALVPALDQTRTVGLVTLPGAFVGMLLGGASPVAAGAAQLLVLVALLAVEAIAVVTTVELVCRGRFTPR